MKSFAEVIQFNASQNPHFVRELRADLVRGQFSRVSDCLEKTLEERLVYAPARARSVIDMFHGLHDLPRELWPDVLYSVMMELINHTYGADVPFFDVQEFPWVAEVESKFAGIRSELEKVVDRIELVPAFQEVQKDQYRITADDKWKVVVFQGFGKKFQDNLDAFPITSEALSCIPEWSTGMFSILKPGKKIPPHTGRYKGVLRYHLGLVVPSGCAISVKGEVRSWVEGGSLIFDDTFVHSAWNESPRVRAVLFVDFLRPLPFPMNLINEWMVFDIIKNTSFIKDTEANVEKFQPLLNDLKAEG